MKLRHKKPLNPYKGQTNNDKNEFNDDDFRQQTSPNKKNGGNPPEQIFKYARILSNFVKTINQDYRIAQGQEQLFQLPLSSERPLSRSKQEMLPERQPLFTKKQQLRQQKLMPKIQKNIEHKEEKKQSNFPSKKRENTPATLFSKQTKNLGNNQPSNPQLLPNLGQALPKYQQEKTNKETNKASVEKVEQTKSKSQLSMANKTATGKVSTVPPSSLSAVPPPNPNFPLNYPNFMNLPNMPANFPGILNQPQLLGNLNLMGLNGINPMQLTQLLMRNYNQNLIYGGLPVGMNMNNLAMMSVNPQNLQNMQNQYNHASLKNRAFTNLFQEQVTSFKTVQESAEREAKSAYPLKRSAFHIAIAYKIYLDKLKKDGKTLQNLEDIDPTKNARRIKSSQQNPKNTKDKDLSRKKK